MREEQPLYVTWDNSKNSKEAAFKQASIGYDQVNNIIHKSTGSNIYQNILPDISVRDGFDKRDYDFFRGSESTPRSQKQLIEACMKSYDRVHIVRNIVDLMADFCSKGIKPVHPSVRGQKLYEEWFKRVAGAERTERIANLLYRCANVIINRHTGTIDPSLIADFRKGIAPVHKSKATAAKAEIPTSYTLYNPLQIEVMGGELAPFVGYDSYTYGIAIPIGVIRTIKNPRNQIDKELIAQLPKAIRQQVLDGQKTIRLDKESTISLYYKRDDWQVWANPMCTAILDQLITLKKMELADRAALDGAISHIRLWRLGSLEHKMLPSPAAINKLASILVNNVAGGAVDLIWGPELELKETSTELHRFLGSSKYEPVLTAIYAGLGVPPTLTGASTGGGGYTNNYISLETLTERLQYGRSVLCTFWEKEAKIVQQAFGLKEAATFHFDRMSLSNKEAEKALLLQLVDRDIISPETVLERFGEDPDIEKYRQLRNKKLVDTGKLPTKAGPFHDAQPVESVKKILAGSGAYTASELGVDLKPRKNNEVPPLTLKNKGKKDKGKNKGEPGDGRPLNSNDKTKRKQKTVKPLSGKLVRAQLWADKAYGEIVKIVEPKYLKSVGCKNLRQLSDDASKNYENLKFAVLCNVPFGSEITEKLVGEVVKASPRIPVPVQQLLDACIYTYLTDHNAEPTVQEQRRLQTLVYATYKGDLDLEEE